MPLPTFVIVGAQKSVTTTLHEWLGQVTGVWVSDPKELHFFDKYERRGVEWYSAQFQPSVSDRASIVSVERRASDVGGEVGDTAASE